MELKYLGLTKHYKNKKALIDFSTTLVSGVYGLLGPNGAGKSTLMNITSGLLFPTNGDVLYDGNSIFENTDKFLGNLGFLPQSPGFYNEFSALKMLTYLGILKGIKNEDEARKRSWEMLEMVNLKDVANKKIGQFSGGMKQRLGIAQAFLHNPGIVILDEPTAGLDPKERIRFRNIISHFAGEKIILLATHIVSDLENISTHILLLKNGVLVKDNKPKLLQNELENMVWEIVVKSDREDLVLSLEKVVNVRREGDKIRIRFIQQQNIPDGAIKVLPGLEDVYLYYFEDVLHENIKID